jgi:3-hydroxyisobutyrate dehydrogenase-like beta-hydroxyacid dehydrogenase
MEVGFIGPGQMGFAMATNLLKAGHRLIVWNRTRSKAEALAEKRALIADLPADVAHASVVITMLKDDDAVIEVLFGRAGCSESLRKGRPTSR